MYRSDDGPSSRTRAVDQLPGTVALFCAMLDEIAASVACDCGPPSHSHTGACRVATADLSLAGKAEDAIKSAILALEQTRQRLHYANTRGGE